VYYDPMRLLEGRSSYTESALRTQSDRLHQASKEAESSLNGS